ncbi:hypothetical protein GJ697_05840 [Pseudoduganella sp. FT25W]|jgi:hypothetical protein|uniref:Uncharacterized protein n=1 Tax=Duganella alba TaxID=2666081 RepID=A0A6L5QC26_9BURK|nr:hypothetical protein [Duganella alba]MRX07353.1 hypothetical protein [Duganella alba]MRX19455.1 hypothetical protein [Duganella alba]
MAHNDVFINCPFDAEFSSLRNAIVFAIYDCGFRPRCALESANGHDYRFEKIKKLIEEARFGIHDISRTELDMVNNLPRFNMPLELGLFIGAMSYGPRRVKDKSLLILDKEQYRYQKYISDIAGQDIRSHNNSERMVIKCVRDWLHSESKGASPLPGGAYIADRYEQFKTELPALCLQVRCQPHELTFIDYSNLASAWAATHQLNVPGADKAEPKAA